MAPTAAVIPCARLRQGQALNATVSWPRWLVKTGGWEVGCLGPARSLANFGHEVAEALTGDSYLPQGRRSDHILEDSRQAEMNGHIDLAPGTTG